MHRRLQFLGSIILMAALAVPAAAIAQDRDHDQDRDHHADKDKDRDRDAQRRVYDRDHRDYHAWDANEARAYNQWAASRHWENRQFEKLNAKQQREYWKWRHQHPDHDRDHDRDHDHDHR
jgi:hypothetical protein